ncbi:unnamed protein product [Parascedosporium putredinis]|uniref:Uncharacterized protein n=1 Tax=Parascedosporium putredinis TaxID=1442378 RepID=A0A9P1GYC0_9PEZI|nr:unnamed protein product [Parascedosporium putredinis]CAI7989797.1 unnamed protein product [Parascedosporium putredinis]
MPNGKLDRRRVAVLSQTANDTDGLVAKLEEGDADAEEGVADGHAGVGVSRGVDDDEVNLVLASLVDPLDDGTLDIGLEGF